jgi:multimeric flavodoxin WrbA
VKRLLIIYHTQGVRTEAMAHATLNGARQIEDVETSLKRAFDTTVEDFLAADGVIFGTPENFGYMSGALKPNFEAAVDRCG